MNTTICRISDNDPSIGVHCQRGGLEVRYGKLVKEHPITVKNLQEKQKKTSISNPLALLKDKCNHSKNANFGKFYNYANIQILVFKG